MHAFLITGNNNEKIKEKVNELSIDLDAKIWEISVKSIEEFRELKKLFRVSVSQKTLIYIQNIHECSDQALNAFLKTLEEPIANIYFALTAPSTSKVLSTIVSRCHVIKIKNTPKEIRNEKEILEFLDGTIGQKLSFFDKIKDREVAINFIEELIFFLHSKKDFSNMEHLLKTLTRLKANGNVNLQLSNLAINFN